MQKQSGLAGGRLQRHWIRNGLLGSVAAGVCALAITLAGAAGLADRVFAAPAGLDKELNMFNWTEYLPQSVIDGFEKEFGVKVNYDTYSSNEEMQAKLQAGASGYDIVVPSDYMVNVLIKQGLLEPLSKAEIPNLKNVGQEFLDQPFDPGNRYTVPYMWGTTGLAVNSEKVKEPITSFNDLWNPKFKGRIVLLDDSREVIGMALKALGYSRNSTDPKQLEASKKKLQELMPLVKAFDSDSPKSLLLSGEVWLGLVWSGEAALANQENPHIVYVLPKEGGGRWQDNLAIPKGARHKRTAEVFINYLLRPEVSAELSQAFPYGNPNVVSHKLTPPEILKNPASYPPSDMLGKAEWLKDVGSATVLYDRIWTEVKGE